MSWLIYFIVILDKFTTITGVLSVIFGLSTLFFVVDYLVASEDGFVKNANKDKIVICKLLTPFIVCITLYSLLPSSKQAAFIFIAPQVIENGAVKDTFKNIPEITALGTQYLKELLKEKADDINS